VGCRASSTNCEYPYRSSVILLGCVLVTTNVAQKLIGLRAFIGTCPFVVAGTGPVGVLA
jgi:hypothetical protein